MARRRNFLFLFLYFEEKEMSRCNLLYLLAVDIDARKYITLINYYGNYH